MPALLLRCLHAQQHTRLIGQVPALCAPYLETALALGLASPAEFHDELARIYLRAVIDASGGASDADGARTAALLCMRVRRRQSLPFIAGSCQDVRTSEAGC